MHLDNFSAKSAYQLIHTICVTALVCCVIISFRVWVPIENHFPVLPIFFSVDFFPLQLLFAFLFAGSITLISLHNSQLLINIALLYVVLFALGDYNRVQPWYFYFLVFLGIINNQRNPKHGIQSIALILACIYIISGVQKINGGFAFYTHPWMLEPLTRFFSNQLMEKLYSLFWIGPAVELFCGIGLLFRKTSRWSAFLLIGMHVFILLMIGPIGRNTNAVVWPWNIAFMIMLFIIFVRSKTNLVAYLSKPKHLISTGVIIVVFILLPLISLINLWPKHLSAALYSGNKIKSEIHIPDELAEKIEGKYKAAYNGIEHIAVPTSWAMNELKIAMYPSKNAHLLLYQKMCSNYPEYSEYFVFKMRPFSDWKTGERATTHYFCNDFE